MDNWETDKENFYNTSYNYFYLGGKNFKGIVTDVKKLIEKALYD